MMGSARLITRTTHLAARTAARNSSKRPKLAKWKVEVQQIAHHDQHAILCHQHTRPSVAVTCFALNASHASSALCQPFTTHTPAFPAIHAKLCVHPMQHTPYSSMRHCVLAQLQAALQQIWPQDHPLVIIKIPVPLHVGMQPTTALCVATLSELPTTNTFQQPSQYQEPYQWLHMPGCLYTALLLPASCPSPSRQL